jgi:hypothetical protein
MFLFDGSGRAGGGGAKHRKIKKALKPHLRF